MNKATLRYHMSQLERLQTSVNYYRGLIDRHPDNYLMTMAAYRHLRTLRREMVSRMQMMAQAS